MTRKKFEKKINLKKKGNQFTTFNKISNAFFSVLSAYKDISDD